MAVITWDSEELWDDFGLYWDGVYLGSGYGQYTLGDYSLPRPSFMSRDQIYDAVDTEMLDGTTKRDYVNRREVIILSWNILSLGDAEAMYHAVEQNRSLVFAVNDGNLVIASMNVFPEIVEFIHQTPGSDYLTTFTLRLTEVD